MKPPKPIDFSKTNVCLYGNDRTLKTWAEHNERGFEVKAFIGGTELDMKQCKKLYKWLDRLFKYHEYKVKK